MVNQLIYIYFGRLTEFFCIMKKYYEHIRRKYGVHVCINLKQYSNQQRKLAKQKQNLKFLLTCRQYGFIPNHLINSTRNTKRIICSNELSTHYEKIQLKFHQKLLNLQISDFHKKIKLIAYTLRQLDLRIKDNLTADEYKQFMINQIQVYKNIFTKKQVETANKIDKLKKTFWTKFNIKFHEKWFVNISDIEFPLEIKWLLSMGKKFAMPIREKDFPLFQLIADGEEVIRTLKDEKTQEEMRAQYSNMLHSFQRHQHNGIFEKYVIKVYKETSDFLKRNKNVIIIPADKGNVTVAMNKNEYDEKMRDLLSDLSTYKLEKTDPTTSLQTKNNSIVKWLYSKKIIDYSQKATMTTYTAQLPSIYGLPKIHKQNSPLRPITSSMKLPCYELSKYIGKILQNVTNNSIYSVKNSFEFIEKAKLLKLHDNDVLVSFDAVSLFTNIPVQLAINIVKKKWNFIKEHTKLSLTKFLEILNFCLNENILLQYNNKVYKQIHGMPMGNPLSPTIADLVLDFLLDESFQVLERPKFLSKYVDDIFVVMDYRKIDDMLLVFNGFDSKIQFTIEEEHNREIAFLDVKVYRDEGRLSFNWHQKPTASGRLINFRSNQPKHTIINTASNLINKVFMLSDKKFHNTNEQILTRILTDNGYPHKIIRSLILRHKTRTISTVPTNVIESVYKSSVYVPRLAENFKHKISKNSTGIHMAYKSHHTISSIFTKLKARPNREKLTDIIYKINCKGNANDPCNLCYVGTTKNFLKQRLVGHKSDIRLKNVSKTALSKHSVEKDHQPDFDNTEILQREKNISKRYTLETLHILNNNNNMNRKQDTQNISSIYRSLVSSK